MSYTAGVAASVLFLGTPDFAVPSLHALLRDPAFDVTLVVTQPDKPVGRKQELTPPAVKTAALAAGVPVFQPLSANKELPAHLEARGIAAPDFLVVVAYGQILSQALLDLPKIAPINVHGSLLPRWRGASPVEHAILAGDAETGITVQRMVHALDAGPILSREAIPIGPRATALELRRALAEVGARLLADTLCRPLREEPQPEEGVTFCRKLAKEDGRADPAAMTAVEIDRRVRALTPWPGVTATLGGQEVKFLETALEPLPGSAPLPCEDGTTLHLVTVQPAGKKPMPGEAWARGRR